VIERDLTSHSTQVTSDSQLLIVLAVTTEVTTTKRKCSKNKTKYTKAQKN